MGHIFTVIAPGAMGSAVSRRMHERGATVRTSLAGRSAASIRHAAEAGMSAVENDRALVEGVDIVLSIVPPGEAVGLAERLLPLLAAASRKPLVVDCNAINPATAARIAAILAPSGAAFADGGIIGGPPKLDGPGPRFYLSGPAAGDAAILREYGVDIRLLDGAIGAASALKMSYGGITKGFTAIAVAMVLGATRAGSASALHKELEASQPHLLAWLTRQVPRMYPKAYRWVAEMEEIGHFLQDGTPSGDMFAAIARLYQDIADVARAPSDGDAVAQLSEFFVKPDEAQERKRA